MTTTRMIMFFGSEYDANTGLPEPFYTYQIFGTDLGGQHGFSAIATVLAPMGGALPPGEIRHFPRQSGTVAQAIDDARQWLISQSIHQGLRNIG